MPTSLLFASHWLYCQRPPALLLLFPVFCGLTRLESWVHFSVTLLSIEGYIRLQPVSAIAWCVNGYPKIDWRFLCPLDWAVPLESFGSIFEGCHCHYCLWNCTPRITFIVLIPLSEVDPPCLHSPLFYLAASSSPFSFPFWPLFLPSLFWLEDRQPPTKTRKLSGCRPPLFALSSPPQPEFTQ